MSKEENSKVVPKMRFPEFRNNGEWEENVLGTICDVRDGTHDSPKFIQNGKPLLTSKNLLQDGTLDTQNVSLISDEDYIQINKRSKVSIGDILFGMIGTIGNPVLVKDDGFAIKNVALIKEKKELLNSYLIHFLNSDYIKYQFNQLMKGNAQKFIALGVIRGIKIFTPNLHEQQKIADCLSSLDELITAESQQLEAVKAHKKGLMQQLFPAEGETVPKRRFKEFRDSGEWEEKTLIQVANYENGKAHEQDIAEDGDYIVVNSKFISTDGEVKKYTNTAFCLACKGDILMVLSDVPNGRAIAKCFYVDADNLYSVNQRICKIASFDANSLMMYYIMNRNQYFLAFDDGVKQTNLRNDDVLNFPFLLPNDIEEQNKIADCLSALDSRITAQAAKIEALKLHKKGLMQGLFPVVTSTN